jgi:hypothetical protein
MTTDPKTPWGDLIIMLIWAGFFFAQGVMFGVYVL